MKILAVNMFDIPGRAAHAAYYRPRTSLDAGADSRMLVQLETSDGDTVIGRFDKAKAHNEAVI